MSQTLSNRICLAYSLPVVSTAWLFAPIGVVQGIYAKYFGVPLTTIATVLLIARLFDAITDPAIGYYADRYYQRRRTYKPFILAGGLLFIVSSYFLYVPPEGVSTFYFTVCFLAFYFAWTLFEMPHITWASQLAPTSEAKTRIYSFRSVAKYIGWLLFYTVPLLPFFETSEITPETLKVCVILASVLMLVFLAISLTTNVDQTNDAGHGVDTTLLPRDTDTVANPSQSFRHLLLSIVNDKPLVIFVGAYMLVAIATSLWYTLVFLYVDAYLGAGKQYAGIFLIAFAVGIAVTPLWYKLAVWWGKKNTWLMATVLLMISFVLTGLMTPTNTNFTTLVILKIIQTMGFACLAAVTPAMLSEIVDYNQWKTGKEHSATYFAIWTFMMKMEVAIAGALGLAIAGWYGFDATAASHSEQSIFGITLAIAWLPLAFSALGLIAIFYVPIDERRHRTIRKRLNARTARLNQSQASNTASSINTIKHSELVDGNM
ncbi:MFS transporter [Porticoccaceae bacterium]|nr:MFS transporter [Porticoccaceae bacterium]